MQSAHLNDTSCVITDVQMPLMSGPEFMTVMRGQGYLVPFIFITAFPDESVRSRALNAGAIGFLAKPFAGPPCSTASPALCKDIAAQRGSEMLV